MNKTRIKVVSDCQGTKYYCEYSIAWFLAWEGMNEDIHSSAVFNTEQEAKNFIDGWIVRQEEYKKQSKYEDAKRKEMKRTRKVYCIEYPPV